LAEWLCIRSVW